MENEDLRYKFDFTRISMPELLTVCSWSAMSLDNPSAVPLANQCILELAYKDSVTDISSIPADMFLIFLREFSEAYAEWIREVGFIK